MSTERPHSGSEHLIILPDREIAEELAEELAEEGFEHVRVVREAARTEEDDEDHEWAVYVREEMITDEGGAVEHGLRDRFAALAEEFDGWYDPSPEADR